VITEISLGEELVDRFVHASFDANVLFVEEATGNKRLDEAIKMNDVYG
jgi:hypothetical protein